MITTPLFVQLTEVFRSVFENPVLVIEASTSAKDIPNWDSMNHILLVTEIENSFGVEFELDDLIAMNTVGDIVKALQSKI